MAATGRIDIFRSKAASKLQDNARRNLDRAAKSTRIRLPLENGRGSGSGLSGCVNRCCHGATCIGRSAPTLTVCRRLDALSMGGRARISTHAIARPSAAVPGREQAPRSHTWSQHHPNPTVQAPGEQVLMKSEVGHRSEPGREGEVP
jgi:hypothetical protein